LLAAGAGRWSRGHLLIATIVPGTWFFLFLVLILVLTGFFLVFVLIPVLAGQSFSFCPGELVVEVVDVPEGLGVLFRDAGSVDLAAAHGGGD
jgi:hypothetical protein